MNQANPDSMDSPIDRSSESPPPEGILGDVESELMGLANSLYNIGTTLLADTTKDGQSSKDLGPRINETINFMDRIDELAINIKHLIPMQVLTDIDHAKNPTNLTKDRIERAATENQFMNGKIHALKSYHELLEEALAANFPEIAAEREANVSRECPAINGDRETA